MSQHVMTCPQCGATNPMHPSFVQWCKVCEWNVDPDGAAVKAAGGAAAEPGSGALVYLVAAAVHAVPIAALLGGIVLIAVTWFSILGLAIGAIFLVFGSLLIPHGTRLPDRTIVLDEDAEPEVYRFAAEVARQQDVPPAKLIGFRTAFVCWSGRTGPLRRPSVVLSYPLWHVLNDEERVALLAVELELLAHPGVMRRPFIASAMQTLTTVVAGSEWDPKEGYQLEGLDVVRQTPGREAAGRHPKGILFRATNLLLAWLARATERSARDAVVEAYQRVAAVRGAEAVQGLLDVEMMTTSMVNAGFRARQRDEPILTAMANYASSFPDHERQRRQLEAQLGAGSGSHDWPSVAERASVLTTLTLRLDRTASSLAPQAMSVELHETIEVQLFDRVTVI